MKSSLFALVFVLLCTNHAFALSDSECMDLKDDARSHLKTSANLQKQSLKAIKEGKTKRGNELFEIQVEWINIASSYSTIYAAFCKD